MPVSPGAQFLAECPEGRPQTPRQLFRCVRAYADYLRQVSGQDGTPVRCEPIFGVFGLNGIEVDLKEAGLAAEGFNAADLGIIAVDRSDRRTRQRFTRAHELMESLVGAIRGGGVPGDITAYIEGPKKERLCNWGASRLLMPAARFGDQLSRHGIGIEAAGEIATHFDASRMAVLWRMAEEAPRQCALTVWAKAHKPRDQRHVAPANQLSMFDDGYRHRPPKKLRAQWSVFKGPARRFATPKHLSVDEPSLIYRAYESGEMQADHETVDLGPLEGTFYIEAVPFDVEGATRVVSLFHWPASMFAGPTLGHT